MGKGASDNIGCVGPWGGMECDDGGGKKGKLMMSMGDSFIHK